MPPLLAIAGLWAAAVVTPGPNLLATVHATLSKSRAHGLLVVLGLVTGTAVWASAAAFGIAAVVAQVGALYTLLKVAGAAYLIWLGVQLFRSGGKDRGPGAPSAGPHIRSGFGAYRLGVLTNLSNPKTAVFFASLYAGLMPPQPSVPLQLASIAVILSISTGWYGSMALAFSHPSVAGRYGRARRTLDRICGGLFIGAGLGLAATESP